MSRAPRQTVTYQGRWSAGEFLRLRHVEWTLPEMSDAHVHIRVGPKAKVTLGELARKAVSWLDQHGIELECVHSIVRAPDHPAGQVTVTVAGTLPERRAAR